jgi:hypothetical protein
MNTLFHVQIGGKVKKHSRNEFNFEATTSRVQNLSYFDQHVVTWQCSLNVLEAINAFATGNYCFFFLLKLNSYINNYLIVDIENRKFKLSSGSRTCSIFIRSYGISIKCKYTSRCLYSGKY